MVCGISTNILTIERFCTTPVKSNAPLKLFTKIYITNLLHFTYAYTLDNGYGIVIGYFHSFQSTTDM